VLQTRAVLDKVDATKIAPVGQSGLNENEI
jgi:hypothetical protein